MSDITRKKIKKISSGSEDNLPTSPCRGAQPLQLQDPPEKDASDKKNASYSLTDRLLFDVDFYSDREIKLLNVFDTMGELWICLRKEKHIYSEIIKLFIHKKNSINILRTRLSE